MTTIVGAVERRSWVEMVMGLPISVVVRGPDARGAAVEQAVAEMYDELRRADRVFSTYRSDSEISLLRSGALAPELASPGVQEVLALCRQAHELTDGLFDAWSPKPDGSRLLDPSGLVKGWAVERAVRTLERLDHVDWLVNAGGDVIGRATYGPAWRVAIEDPQDRTAIVCVLPLESGAIATSGTAARGQHILDPRSGGPAAGALGSATVIGPSLTWADVLATALFVEGPDGLGRVHALDGYAALVVDVEGRITATAGLRLPN